MSLATAFAELKAHAQALLSQAESGIAVEFQHLKDLFTKVETVGEHVVQEGRTLVTVDMGHISAADAKALVEKALSGAQAVITDIRLEAEAVAAKAEAAIEQEAPGVAKALGLTQS